MMRLMKEFASTLLLVMLCGVAAYSQSPSSQEDEISKLLEAKVSSEMPGWTHRNVEPIEGSRDVTIHLWEVADVAVKVAITRYANIESATKALAQFEHHTRMEKTAAKAHGKLNFQLLIEDELPVGDRSFVWKIRGSDAVASRQGRFLVFVSVVRPEPNTDSYLSKKFAKCTVDVLSSQ
jgi:hypothetical protein